MKILFVTSNRIGDAVLSMGILEHLRKNYPDARITVACGQLPSPLFEDLPCLEKLIILQRRGTLGHWVSLWKETVGYSWDHVIDIRGSAFSWFVWARKRYIWRSPRSSGEKHRVEQLGALLDLDSAPGPVLWISPQRMERVCGLLPRGNVPILAIGPAANWPGKEWPLDSFIALEKMLTHPEGLFPGAFIMPLAAPHEYERINPFIESIPVERRISLPRDLSLADVGAALSRATLFVGNDSGLMHMAAATGIPVLGLFGPSPEKLYAPWGARATYIRTRETCEELKQRHRYDRTALLMSSLTTEDVFEAIRKMEIHR